MPAAQMTELARPWRISYNIHAGWAYGPDYDDPEDIDRAYRQVAKRLHPEPGAPPLTSRGCRRQGGYSRSQVVSITAKPGR